MMHFTRETTIVLDILAACAGTCGRSLCLRELMQLAGHSTAQTVHSILLLQDHGLLSLDAEDRISLAIDPIRITLGAILRLTQPELVEGEADLVKENVLTLALEAASRNFLTIADRFTMADVIADRKARKCRAA